MKQATIILLSMLGAALGLDEGFRVKFGAGAFGDDDHYIQLPITLAEAKSQDWTLERRADKVLPFSLAMYCHPTFIICVFYDDTEHAAGIQIAVPETEFKDVVWDWDILGYIKWTASNGKRYWTKQQYYVNQEYLSTDAQERVANRDPTTLLQAGGNVWVSGNRGELFEITKRPDHLLNNGFTEQGCFPGMGLHFWRLNQTTECNSEIFNWFTLYDNARDLVGTGMAVPGKLDAKDLPKDWFERPNLPIVRATLPRGPQCIYDLVSNPGFIILHIYYVSAPWEIDCL